MSIYRNQRANARTSIAGKIKYARDAEGDWCFDARLFDCGTDGMGLISEFPYLRDTELFLKSRNNKDDATQKAEVAWCRPAPKFTKQNPRYRVGVHFAP